MNHHNVVMADGDTADVIDGTIVPERAAWRSLPPPLDNSLSYVMICDDRLAPRFLPAALAVAWSFGASD